MLIKHWSCMLVLLGSYTFFIAAVKIIPADYCLIISSILLVMSVLIILVLTPVEDINKPIELDEADKLKKRIYIIMPVVSVVSCNISVF